MRGVRGAPFGYFHCFMLDKRNPCANLTPNENRPIGQSLSRPEAVDLMYSLVQDCHDPDIATQEMAPMDEMALMAKEEIPDAEFGRNGF